MYMRRKIDDFLTHWKESPDHMPLIIKGARQIGKTASIREFARKNYKNFIEINFIFEPQYKQITVDGYSSYSSGSSSLFRPFQYSVLIGSLYLLFALYAITSASA